jgi:ATP-dependent RNA helicase RhlE
LSNPVPFSSLGLSNSILTALHEEGYDTPTPIQAQSIPPILSGRDVLGCAQTGTGKTAAFALPIIHRLMTEEVDKTKRGTAMVRALIVCPTRELATQIGESIATYGRHAGLRHAVIYGGVKQFHQVKAIQRGVDVLVATPGRLIDLMEQGLVHLQSVRVLVLDESDRMLDMGFINPIRRIASQIPAGRQTLLFSATMPREIVRLAESLLKDPVRVSVTPVASAVPLIDQSVYMVPRIKKMALLEHLINEGNVQRAVVFTRTKHGADKLGRRLERSGITSQAIHGNKAQNQRERALAAFRTGRSRVLVATDVAARGLDVDGITHVFNFDLPNEPEAYVHRIGRTGRAGATGVAISFCDGEERAYLRDIEKLTGKKIPAITQLPALPESATSIGMLHEPRDDAGEPMPERRRWTEADLSMEPADQRTSSNHGGPHHRGGTGGGHGPRPQRPHPDQRGHSHRDDRDHHAQRSGHKSGHAQDRGEHRSHGQGQGHSSRPNRPQGERSGPGGHSPRGGGPMSRGPRNKTRVWTGPRRHKKG